MDTRNKGNIPTYSTVEGIYKGNKVKGILHDNPLRVVLEPHGTIKLQELENPKTVYEVWDETESVTANGTSGIISLTNGVDINYGPYSQYKTKREAMAFAEAVADLCAGIDVSMAQVGRAMDNDGWISVKDRLPDDGEIVDIWEMPRTQLLERALSLKGTPYANENYHDTDYLGWRSCNYKFTIEHDGDAEMNCFTKVNERYFTSRTGGGSYKKLCVENGEVFHWKSLPKKPSN